MNSVIHVVPSINARVGGPASSVPALSDALWSQGIASEIWTQAYPELGSTRLTASPVRSFPLSAAGKLARGRNPAFFRALRKRIHAGDIIHSHGLWMSPHRYARQVAAQQNGLLVISPRGMLQDWSRQHHAVRKKLAWALFEKENLRCATGFHATSSAEAAAIRALGFKQPIALISNGIQRPLPVDIQTVERFRASFSLSKRSRYCLFLSRLHKKKGLSELLDAWKKLAHDFPDWILIIAGPDNDHYWDRLQRERAISTRDDRVLRLPMVSGVDREALFQLSEVLVLPSFSENFGIVIGEALIRGVPVITTPHVPWPDVERNGAGFVCEPNPLDIERTLRRVLSLPADTLQGMGVRGQEQYGNRFNWCTIGAQMQSFHAYLGGETDRCDTLYRG